MRKRLEKWAARIALVALAVPFSTGGCLNFMPTQPSDPEGFCSQSGLFYCNTTIRMQVPMPNGWPGYCTAAIGVSGRVAYSGVTGNGQAIGAFATSDEAWWHCGASAHNPQGMCAAVVRCTKP